MKKGFTLIEVLIVVIILGILATLAIPQFTRMTRRARLAEAWAGLGGIRTAQAVYKMEKTVYAGNLTDIDFDTPDGSTFSYSIASGNNATWFNAIATGGGLSAGINAWITTDSSGYQLP